MRLEHYSVEKLREEIRAIVRARLDDAYEVFFFGLRVAGGGDERSDIDVGIDGPGPVPGIAMAHIREAIEDLPTLYTIDVVDFGAVSPEFRAEALEHTERIA